MRLRKQVCVVIDAYSTARLLAPAFAALGYATVHVQTLATLSEAQREALASVDYLDALQYRGDVPALAAELAQRHPHIRCIVAGIESGVTLADQLSEHFGLASNGSRLSPARRDKHVMARVVEAAGLDVIPCFKTRDLDEAVAWLRLQGIDTAVLKPKSSSGTFGFNICQGEAELRQTFARLLDSRDVFDERVDELLVQPLVEGQEYAVNFVSSEGRHLISDIWRTDKSRRGQSKVYEQERLVLQDDPHYPRLHAYVSAVLDALGIRFGPSHTEVMVTREGQVLLIESAARLMGALDVSLVTEALGHNAVQLTAEAYLCPQRFAQRLAGPTPALQRHASMVQMLSRSRGRLRGFALPALQRMASFHGVDLFQKEGDALVPTIDSYTSPGLVFLSHSDPAVLDLDYRSLRELEQAQALYRFDPEA